MSDKEEMDKIVAEKRSILSNNEETTERNIAPQRTDRIARRATDREGIQINQTEANRLYKNNSSQSLYEVLGITNGGKTPYADRATIIALSILSGFSIPVLFTIAGGIRKLVLAASKTLGDIERTAQKTWSNIADAKDKYAETSQKVREDNAQLKSDNKAFYGKERKIDNARNENHARNVNEAKANTDARKNNIIAAKELKGLEKAYRGKTPEMVAGGIIEALRAGMTTSEKLSDMKSGTFDSLRFALSRNENDFKNLSAQDRVNLIDKITTALKKNLNADPAVLVEELVKNTINDFKDNNKSQTKSATPATPTASPPIPVTDPVVQTIPTVNPAPVQSQNDDLLNAKNAKSFEDLALIITVDRMSDVVQGKILRSSMDKARQFRGDLKTALENTLDWEQFNNLNPDQKFEFMKQLDHTVNRVNISPLTGAIDLANRNSVRLPLKNSKNNPLIPVARELKANLASASQSPEEYEERLEVVKTQIVLKNDMVREIKSGTLPELKNATQMVGIASGDISDTEKGAATNVDGSRTTGNFVNDALAYTKAHPGPNKPQDAVDAGQALMNEIRTYKKGENQANSTQSFDNRPASIQDKENIPANIPRETNMIGNPVRPAIENKADFSKESAINNAHQLQSTAAALSDRQIGVVKS